MSIKEQLQRQIKIIEATGKRKKDGNLIAIELNKIKNINQEIEKLKAWTNEKPPEPTKLRIL